MWTERQIIAKLHVCCSRLEWEGVCSVVGRWSYSVHGHSIRCSFAFASLFLTDWNLTPEVTVLSLSRFILVKTSFAFCDCSLGRWSFLWRISTFLISRSGICFFHYFLSCLVCWQDDLRSHTVQPTLVLGLALGNLSVSLVVFRDPWCVDLAHLLLDYLLEDPFSVPYILWSERSWLRVVSRTPPCSWWIAMQPTHRCPPNRDLLVGVVWPKACCSCWLVWLCVAWP